MTRSVIRSLMRGAGARLIAALLLASIGRAAAHADPEATPFDAVRTLQNLQDRIATGDPVAQAAYAKAMQRTARSFATIKLATWADKRNARALITFLFSGGSAAAINAAIPHHALASEFATLYSGALAYGLGQDEAARKILLPIEAKTLPSGLGGHLALVQATLIANSDHAKAIVLLDMARLLEPGTLVEEAALRKEMLLIGAGGDLDKFSVLARRYMGSFSHSVYADNFRQLFARTAMQVGGEVRADAIGRLTTLTEGLSRDEKRRLFLAIAREAVVDGRLDFAATISDQAGRLALRNENDEARAMVYFGAATIVGSRYDAGMRALAAASPAKLDARDRALRASALAVGAMIRANPSNTGVVQQTDQQAAVLAQAERSLASADTLLMDGRR